MTQQPMMISEMIQAHQQLTAVFQTKRMDKASYSAMFLSALTSTLFGYLLLHKPAVKNINSK